MSIHLDINRAIEADIETVYNVANYTNFKIKLNRHNTNVNYVSDPTIQVGDGNIIAGIVPIARYMEDVSKKGTSTAVKPFVIIG